MTKQRSDREADLLAKTEDNLWTGMDINVSMVTTLHSEEYL